MEISLKKVRREGKDLVAPAEIPHDMYPNFSIYEDVPKGLMNLDIGKEVTAKLKVTMKEMREGKNSRESIGFDCISITTSDKE
jgi:hypothetical protein